ncbi:helix-turn-helix domain-containing protein [Streptomyces sp. NPDC091371]|uniref:helix-turn-helix domain-containing protein n=1 Tax=Streptomyces sp. NPDC091371 TaxID=3155303 RepID=UPI003435B9FB
MELPPADGAERAGGGPRPTPPTEPVRLAALLGTDGLGLRLLGGGADVRVHGVHASEMADPSPYLLGGELLLTAGADLTGASPAGQAGEAVAGLAGSTGQAGGGGEAEEYVRRLVRAGVAALGFGVTPVHETVPRTLVEACERHGLPLLEVPPATPFTAVARAVWRLMAEARTRELRRVTEAQQSLAAAAARPDPVPAVLSRLAASLGGHVTLWPDGRSAGAPPPPGAAAALHALLARAGRPGGPSTATDQAAGWHLAAYALGRPTPAAGSAPETPAPRPGSAPATPAAQPGPAPDSLPATGTVPATAPGRPAPGPGTSASRAGGSGTPANQPGPSAPAGLPEPGPATALGVAAPARSPGDHTIASVAAVLLSLLTTHRPARAEAAALTRLLLGGSPADALAPGPWYVVHARGAADPHALAAALGTVLLDAQGDRVRLLADREPAVQPGWRLGVSAPAGPAELATADAQARRALERAEAARTPLGRPADPGFAGLVGEAEARAHAEALLAPLNPALRETLRAWLAHHGSWDRTAAALGVHRNTVRQRISRAAALLDRDLDDPDTRMELWFALRWEATPPAARPAPPPEAGPHA